MTHYHKAGSPDGHFASGAPDGKARRQRPGQERLHQYAEHSKPANRPSASPPDPLPVRNYPLIDDTDIADLKTRLLESGLTVRELVYLAWSAASTFRALDKRGGANGARIRLEPQKNWDVNEPRNLQKALQALEQIQTAFYAEQTDGKRVSLADLIVLGGAAAIEKAAKDAGLPVTVPFQPGRTDAGQEQTDAAAFAAREPQYDVFRNYQSRKAPDAPAEERLLASAAQLGLTAAEATALIGGLRVLGATYQSSDVGVLTRQPGTLTNDFFLNLLDPLTGWKPQRKGHDLYEGTHHVAEKHRWSASGVDLAFRQHTSLRVLAEAYAKPESREKFVHDFIAAWNKVMNADRFDLS